MNSIKYAKNIAFQKIVVGRSGSLLASVVMQTSLRVLISGVQLRKTAAVIIPTFANKKFILA
jgi:hypothetical protein